jgi:monofunctional chorismate mutase
MTENKLENLRKEIDVIDNEIVKLFAKRLEVVKQIGVYKKENKIDVVDNKRFQKVLEKVENLAGKNGIVNYDRK